MNSIIAPKPVLVNGPKVGDILMGSFGYEARIAVWCCVVKVNPKTIVLVELADIQTPKANAGGMYWTSMPGEPNGKEETKLVKIFTDHTGKVTYRVKWNSCCRLYPWTGKSIECYDVH
jgi:hypothetical protein